MRMLIEREADVDAPAAECGWTALEGAAEHGELDAVRMLLDRGVYINAPATSDFHCE